MTILGCDITHSDAEVLVPYIDDISSSDYKKYKMLHDGITLSSPSAYSPCFGTVVDVGRAIDGTYTVSILYDPNSIIRMCNLETCNVKAGQAISTNTRIGSVKHNKLKIEHATTRNEGSQSVVRVDGNTYYKHDPTAIVSGFNKYIADGVLQDVPESVKLMLTNNRGTIDE